MTASLGGWIVPGLADRIRQSREQRGWSQDDLACEIGLVSGKKGYQSWVSKWEREVYAPNALAILALSKAFGVSADWLLGGQEHAASLREVSEEHA